MKKFLILLILLVLPFSSLSAESLDTYFQKLTTEPFDQTNDGITEADLQKLKTKTNTETWKVEKTNANEIVIQSVHPSSEVHLQLKTFGDVTPVFEVHVQNEKVSRFFYYDFNSDKTKLTRAYPAPFFTMINEVLYEEFQKKGQTDFTKVPLELKEHVNNIFACQHWYGEISGDEPPERKKQIEDNLKKFKCESLEKTQKALLQKYQKPEEWKRVLEKSAEVFGF